MFDWCQFLLVERTPKQRRTKSIWIVEQRIVKHPNVPHNTCSESVKVGWKGLNLIWINLKFSNKSQYKENVWQACLQIESKDNVLQLNSLIKQLKNLKFLLNADAAAETGTTHLVKFHFVANRHPKDFGHFVKMANYTNGHHYQRPLGGPRKC